MCTLDDNMLNYFEKKKKKDNNMLNYKFTIGFLIIAYYIYTSLIIITNHLLFKQHWLWLDPNVCFWGVHIPTRWSKNFE